MQNISINNLYDIEPKHKQEHEQFEYYKRELVPKSDSRKCAISFYEIPPGKSAYPYHYHTQNEECFYIISGSGLLKTPEGDKSVTGGNFVYFHPSEKGAHKLTNISTTENLVYLDFDTTNSVDVAIYPDSNKIGIWGNGIDQIFRISDSVDYYEGE